MLTKNPIHKQLLIKVILIAISLVLAGIVVFGGYSYINLEQLVNLQKQSEITRDNSIRSALAAKEARKKLPVYVSLPGASKIRAIVDNYTLPSSIWAIASKTHSIPTDYTPSPIKIPNVLTRTDKSDEERSVRSDIETPLVDMFAAASAAGYQLMIGSGYRSADLQAVYFNSLAGSVGEEVANQSIARPGQSEHQTGLAVDISTVSYECYLDNCFANTGDGQWLLNNSYRFGFILRYAEDKVAITGYRYEPWHFRYVGIDLATALHESGLTLDEAEPYLQIAEATLIKNGAIEP
jgi:zinc D-Ala-D-Ala carboxypeptidase